MFRLLPALQYNLRIFAFLTCMLTIPNFSLAQSHLDYALEIWRFKNNRSIITAAATGLTKNSFNDTIRSKAFLDEFIEKLNKPVVNSDTGETTSSGGGIPGSGMFENGASVGGAIPQTPTVSVLNNDQNLSKKITTEIDTVIYFLDKLETFSVTGTIDTALLDTALPDLEYLKKLNDYIESVDAKGLGTSIGLSSVLGISEAEILKGITDWAIARAQEELMQAFLRGWLDKLENDTLLQVIFPNTKNFLLTSDLTTLITQGTAWKEAFQADFDALPTNIPKLTRVSLEMYGIKLTPAQINEITSAVEAAAIIYDGIAKKKKVDEVLLLMGENADQKPVTQLAVADRTILMTNILLNSISYRENGELAYYTPSQIVKLTPDQLDIWWAIVFTREKDRFQKVFGYKSASQFYDATKGKLMEFRTKTAELAGAYMTMVEFLNVESGINNKVELDVNQVHRYFMSTLDLMEKTVDFVNMFHPDPIVVKYEFNRVEDYLNTCFTYIAGIQEGASTKKYGKVITNSVNLVLWIKNEINQSALEELRMRGDSLILAYKVHNEANLDSAKATIKGWIDNDNNNSATLIASYQGILNTLNNGTINNTENFEKLVRQRITLSSDDIRKIIEELAPGLSGLENTSLAINRYGKLMVNILDAENSDDIKKALEETAMKSGGYMVKQLSAASVSVVFYPGFGVGHEFLKESTQVDAMKKEGTFLGAKLPIGVEMSLGLEDTWGLGALGFYLQVLDLGAVLNYSLNADSTSTLPEFGFEQVLSPGGYVVFHFKKTPLTLGTGITYTPKLRSISDGVANTQANAIQVGAFLAIDLTVFPLYTSRRKFKELPRKFR